MGNESSSLNGTTNKSMDDLQKQILENQLEIQRIQINNLQSNSNNTNNNNNNNTNNNSINLAAIFSNPQLQQEIGKNPQKKIALLENIINLSFFNHGVSGATSYETKRFVESAAQNKNLKHAYLNVESFYDNKKGIKKQHGFEENILNIDSNGDVNKYVEINKKTMDADDDKRSAYFLLINFGGVF